VQTERKTSRQSASRDQALHPSAAARAARLVSQDQPGRSEKIESATQFQSAQRTGVQLRAPEVRRRRTDKLVSCNALLGGRRWWEGCRSRVLGIRIAGPVFSGDNEMPGGEKAGREMAAVVRRPKHMTRRCVAGCRKVTVPVRPSKARPSPWYFTTGERKKVTSRQRRPVGEGDQARKTKRDEAAAFERHAGGRMRPEGETSGGKSR